jgi:hypothetical protein
VRIEAVCALPCASATVPMVSRAETEVLVVLATIYLRLEMSVVLKGNDMWGSAESGGSMNLELDTEN